MAYFSLLIQFERSLIKLIKGATAVKCEGEALLRGSEGAEELVICREVIVVSGLTVINYVGRGGGGRWKGKGGGREKERRDRIYNKP